MNALYWTIRNYLECPREEGQTLTEYALIIALIAILLIVALGLVRGGIQNVFTRISTALNNAT
jgi:Flp pilus assembly pilin Flp